VQEAKDAETKDTARFFIKKPGGLKEERATNTYTHGVLEKYHDRSMPRVTCVDKREKEAPR
jgi:hypothetical protein